MTDSEYTKQADAIDEKIEAAKKELNSLREQYVSEYWLRFGDKVRITRRKWCLNGPDQYESIDCFVGRVGFRYSSLDIQFHKIKKDGTMSGQSAGIYYDRNLKIEKLPC